nr:hypothetical protein [Fusobacteriaceae bacterium]
GYLILYKIVELPKEEVVQTIKYIEKEIVKKEVVEETENDINISINEIKTKWKDIRDKVSRKKIALKAFLYEASVSKLSGNKLYLMFPKDYSYHKEMMEKRETNDILEAVLVEVFGKEIKVIYELEGQKEKKHVNTDGGLVDKVKDFFDGEIIK